MSSRDDQGLTFWLKSVFEAINGPGRLGPPKALRKRLDEFLDTVSGDEVLQLATIFGMGNPEAVRRLAQQQPDLGSYLSSHQQPVDDWFEENQSRLELYHKSMKRLMQLAPPASYISFNHASDPGKTERENWGKVFQIIGKHGGNDEESGNL